MKRKSVGIMSLLFLLASCQTTIVSPSNSSFISSSLSFSSSSTFSFQEDIALKQAKEEGKTRIEEGTHLANYEKEEQEQILLLKTQAKEKIEQAQTKEEVTTIVDDYFNALSSFLTKKEKEEQARETYRKEIIAQIQGVSLSLYEEEEQKEIFALEEEMIKKIEATNDEKEMEALYLSFQAKLSSFLTKEEKEAIRDLKETKEKATANLKEQLNLLSYTKENRKVRVEQYQQGKKELENAQSKEEVLSIQNRIEENWKKMDKDENYQSSLLFGSRFSFISSSLDEISAIRIAFHGASLQGEGLYLRIRNLVNEDMQVAVHMNETDSDRISFTPCGTYILYRFDAFKEERTTREEDGQQLTIPASFDGYLYLPYSSFRLLEGYGEGNKTFDFTSVFALYLETSVFQNGSGYRQNYLLGDVLLQKEDDIDLLIDNQTMQETNYQESYIRDYNVSYIQQEFFIERFTTMLFSHLENETGKEKYYNYCPTAFEENGVRYVYYCANQKDGNVTDYIALRKGILKNGKWTYGDMEYVLSPSASGWDSRHTCDPSVIKGTFTYQEENYSYLMAYLGCLTSDSTQNEVGFAVSKTPEGPFIKIDANPICDYEKNASSGFQWGYGQPSLVSIDKKGKIMLFYTVGDGMRTYQRIAKLDASSLDEITPLEEEKEVLVQGLTNLNGTQDIISNADFAYDPDTNRIYMVKDDHPNLENADVSSSISISYLEDRYKDYSLFTPGYILTHYKSKDNWVSYMRINENYSGKTLNHNSGFLTDAYGWLMNGEKIDVLYTGADYLSGTWNALRTYRIYQTTIKKGE